jgi:NAD+ kinase
LRISRVGIVVKPRSDQASEAARNITAFLQAKGVETFQFCPPPNGSGSEQKKGSAGMADLLVVVGGDGTVMRAAEHSADIPLLGVKIGALGFLCETIPDRANASLDKILAGEYFLEHKSKIKVSYGKKALPDALNEAMVCTSRPSKIMSLIVMKDGEPLHKGRADGVIVSTTTGSTAYALSAGGPIIDSQLDIMEIVFMCPLAAGLKPLVLPSSSKVEITVMPEKAHGILVIDGQLAIDLDFEKPVAVERSDRSAVFVRVSRPDFYRRVREKLKTGLEV